MTASLKKQWYFLSALSLLVLVGTILNMIASHSTKIEIPLQKEAKTEVSVFRLAPDNLTGRLLFSTKKGVEYPEHGGNQLSVNAYVESDGEDPAQVLSLQAKVKQTGQTTTYVAFHGNSWGADFLSRPLRSPTSPLNLASGLSDIEFEILEMGHFPNHQSTTLVIQAPLSFKLGSSGIYAILWWFFFWPLYAAILALYALILGWFTWRSSKLALNL